MSTATLAPGTPEQARTKPPPAPIPMSRILAVELRKMFDTRSGFWLMASIGISALLATAAVIVFAPASEQTYDSFGAAIGFPMVVILPMIAILSVTSEWSQRSGLTTFTLVPHRSRVMTAKLVLSIAIGAVSIAVALAIGAVGNVVGSTLAGVDTVWDISLNQALCITLANVLGMLMGFMLGVLIRNSPGAIVAYFVYGFVLAGLTGLLAMNQQWFADLQPWVDFNFTQGLLFDGNLTTEQWSQLAVSGTLWLLIPLAIGMLFVRRSEIK
jgi:ABC-2 type transport system permease protein